MRTGEGGQVMPLAALVLAALVLIALAVARVGSVITARIRMQTATDAVALSAATAYSRALNIAAVSNEMLLTAALADLGLKVFGSSAAKVAAKPLRVAGLGLPSSFTEAVEKFQDAWAGSGTAAVFASPGAGALLVQGTAAACAQANGIDALVFWNGREDPGGMVPDLNLRRATLGDLAALLGDGSAGRTGAGTDRVRVQYEQKQARETYSYRDSKTGRKVQVSADRVEKIAFRNRRKIQTAARVKERGGKFLKVTKGTEKVLRFLDVPFPLLEKDPVHEVLVVARSRTRLPRLFGTEDSLTAAARAQACGGAVFDASFGNPAFEPGLRPVSSGPAEGMLAMALIRDPRAFESLAAQAAATAAFGWVRKKAVDALNRSRPGNI